METTIPSVVIFGAGVTGLTAAHELAERGWKVTVVEKEIDPLNIDECAVGGIAKTQWSAYQPPQHPARKKPSDLPDPSPPANAAEPMQALPLLPTVRLRRAPNQTPAPTAPFEASLLDIGSQIYLGRLLNRINSIAPCYPRIVITFGSDADLATKFGAYLVEVVGIPVELVTVNDVADPSLPKTVCQIETDLCDRPLPQNPADFASILPGEHGFRFFPAFYRHIFDTLRRIPIRAPNENYGDSHRTVFDNLLPTEANWLAISDASQRPHSKTLDASDGNNVVKFPRRLPRSLREAFDATDALQSELGYTARDVELLKLRLFKYMTSCRRRRKEEYEGMSWSEFLGLSDLSPICQQDMERAPQLLAAMTATESDARTQGNVATQLLLDPISRDERVDATLNAPTTVAWFAPWKDYLLSQNVQFVPGELVGFEADTNPKTGKKRIVPRVTADAVSPEFKECDYFVLALPVQAWSKDKDKDEGLLRSWASARNAIGSVHPDIGEGPDDIDRLYNWLVNHVGPEENGSGKLYKGLTGIQFYFDADEMTRSGHTVFMDSPWRLSAISQASFWHRRRESFDGYRGLLSVDIGSLTDHDPNEPSFLETKRRDVHQSVWNQINKSYGAFHPAPTSRNYRMYHLDELVQYNATTEKPIANLAPFLINGLDEWNYRPGWRDGTEPESTAVESPSKARYQLMPQPTLSTPNVTSNWVLAGTFMQTWTRATTMESANESARHAVNTLLDDASKSVGLQAELCRIWNPEEYEHPDLLNWQELDERLFEWADGPLPHMFDILELDTIPLEILESGKLSQVVQKLTGAALT